MKGEGARSVEMKGEAARRDEKGRDEAIGAA